MSSRSGEDGLTLRTFSSTTGHSGGLDRNVSEPQVERIANVPVPEEEPTRTYQCLLVLAGFNMTFHVFGINTLYSIFQVRLQYVFIGTLL